MKVTLKTITPDAETNIVEIARVSSTRQDKSEAPEGLINYLIKNKHWSPFEHSHLTFEIVTSKAIAIQYLRHVSFRFQEFSQRYAEVNEIEPIEFRLQAEKNRQSSTDIVGTIYVTTDDIMETVIGTETTTPEQTRWMNSVTMNLMENLELYRKGLELGIAKECARMILPMATQTTLYMTGNMRSWIHLMDIRDDSHAQKEARMIAKEIKRIFIEKCPIISKALNYE